MQKINIKNLLRPGLQNEIRPLHLVLADRSGEKLGEVDNVFNINSRFGMQTSEISFTVCKSAGGRKCRLWDELIPRRLLWVKEYDEWFEIYTDIDESRKIPEKNITATALCQAELSQIYPGSFGINTEDDISRPDYEVSVFYNPEKPKASILHRVLEKVPNYTIKHVDSSICDMQRSFNVSSDTSIYDFLTKTLQEEIGCLFLFNSGERGIYVYDINTYGNDTSIFVSKENLGENIRLTSNANEVKNCFRVSGGDELINSAVININPAGSDTIYIFDEDTRKDMPPELIEKLDDHDRLLTQYNATHLFELPENAVNKYNSLVSGIALTYPDRFTPLDISYSGYSELIKRYYDIFDMIIFLETGMMPAREYSDKTAASQALLIKKELKYVSVSDTKTISKASADNAVLLMAKSIIDTGTYKCEIVDSSLDSLTWNGQIRLTCYSDGEDSAVAVLASIPINDDTESFIRQRLQKAAAKIETPGIKDLFEIEDADDLKAELKKYCLASLKGFLNAYQTAIDILVEEKISDPGSDLYEDLYSPYYNRYLAAQKELSVREADIEAACSMQEAFEDIIHAAHDTLDLEKYLGPDLWNVFLSYRREDKYENDNYISDGLDNSRIIEKAGELVQTAYRQLADSSIKQYSITGTLHNLLLISDENGKRVFEPILDDFTLGNFIRCKIDGAVYKMRILDVTVDYDDLSSLSITFGDITKGASSISDKVKDIISRTNSVAASYNSVKRQAKQGAQADRSLEKLKREGLDTAVYNIYNSYSTFIMDNHGLLGRNYDDVTDQFSDEQIRINGSNIVLTDDAWRSTKMAVGKQTYTLNGITEETYGVNADTCISSRIIGGDIYSANYLTDTSGQILKGTHFDLTNGSFQVAGGRLSYDPASDVLSLRNGTLSGGSLIIGDRQSGGVFAEITSDGRLSCRGADIDGAVYAVDGNIGGWTITETDLYDCDASMMRMSHDNGISGAGIGKYGFSPAFWAGTSYSDRNNAPLRLKHNGELYAEKAIIKGGSIGGWDINERSIHKTICYGGNDYTVYIQTPEFENSIEKDDVWVLSVQKNQTGKWYVTAGGYMRCTDGYFATRNNDIDGRGIEISGSNINFYSWSDKDNFAGSIFTGYSSHSPSTQTLCISCDIGDELHLGYTDNDGIRYTSVRINDPTRNNGQVRFYSPIENIQGHTLNTIISENGNISLETDISRYVISVCSSTQVYYNDTAAALVLIPYYDPVTLTWNAHVISDIPDLSPSSLAGKEISVQFVTVNSDLAVWTC